jgi:hypothetical protein
MHIEGKSWKEIFAMCLPDRALYGFGDAYRNAKQGLKKAVRLREKRTQASEHPSLPGRGIDGSEDRRIPHPQHWKDLAEPVGVSADGQ